AAGEIEMHLARDAFVDGGDGERAAATERQRRTAVDGGIELASATIGKAIAAALGERETGWFGGKKEDGWPVGVGEVEAVQFEFDRLPGRIDDDAAVGAGAAQHVAAAGGDPDLAARGGRASAVNADAWAEADAGLRQSGARQRKEQGQRNEV